LKKIKQNFISAIALVRGFPQFVLALIPSAAEHLAILALLDRLKPFESVSKHHQTGGT
jgi:hypothetical protein